MRLPDRFFAVAALLLAALAIWPWVAPASTATPTAGTGEGAPPVPELAALPPLATFSAVSERPLFAPSRRPPPNARMSRHDGDPGRYRLLGLLTVGDSRRALVADGSRRFEIAEGALLDSWTVARIEQDRVVLSSPSGQSEMRLRPAEGERSGSGDKPAR